MASNRHLGRIISLQSLYEFEFREKAGDTEANIDTIIAKNIEPYEKALGDTEFVYFLTRSVLENAKSLDQELTPLAPDWPISSIAAIDRNVLRIGLYELKYCGDKVPPKVAINEAVELAKAFGSDNSSRFINGVLGTAFRQINPEAANKEKHEESKQEEKPAAPEESSETLPETSPEISSEKFSENSSEKLSEKSSESSGEGSSDENA